MEAGDTLIEVLLALVVISLTAVALLTAFGTSISASAEHKDEATLDSVLKSFVEQATYQLGRQTTSPKFVACATPSTYSNVTMPPVTTAQGTYTASITAVQYWQSNNTWSPPTASVDRGVLDNGDAVAAGAVDGHCHLDDWHKHQRAIRRVRPPVQSGDAGDAGFLWRLHRYGHRRSSEYLLGDCIRRPHAGIVLVWAASVGHPR